MKKKFLKLVMIAGFFLVSGIAAKAQVVTTRPIRSNETARTARPRPSHYYWRGDDWEWSNGSYQSVPGQWVERPAGGKWKNGYWDKVKGGEVWRSGHWK